MDGESWSVFDLSRLTVKLTTTLVSFSLDLIDRGKQVIRIHFPCIHNDDGMMGQRIHIHTQYSRHALQRFRDVIGMEQAVAPGQLDGHPLRRCFRAKRNDSVPGENDKK